MAIGVIWYEELADDTAVFVAIRGKHTPLYSQHVGKPTR